MNIEAIANSIGEKLTEKGNLELGSNDQGWWNPPGGSIGNRAVTFYLLPSGDVRAVIDNRSGSNQGYIQWNYGDVEKIDGADLDEAIELAKDHCASMGNDSENLTKAWRIASAAARATQRKIEAAGEMESGLESFSTEALEAELKRRREF